MMRTGFGCILLYNSMGFVRILLPLLPVIETPTVGLLGIRVKFTRILECSNPMDTVFSDYRVLTQMHRYSNLQRYLQFRV